MVESRDNNELMVDEAFEQLLSSYRNSQHRKKEDIIVKAFNFARQAHRGVRRLSGEPYIMHPIAVAQIACSDVGLGSTSIAAALLHDVVEDTDYTIEDIENIFGRKIAQIVDGLTKISGGIFGDKASAQAENFKKLLLTMSDDIRVILIKICDRLHNMRTLSSQPANKQYKIAGETLYIYAPLANRLGLNRIKTELEDLSFRYDHPDIYDSINKKLENTRAQRDILFEDFTAPIREALDSMGFSYEIKARVKTPYSIWNKMQKKHVTFEEIYDILAVRIIFKPLEDKNEVDECFRIYVALNKIYNSHPDRLRDWVSQPKTNGYQALHVTLMSKLGQWIEVQIRSERMDEQAEQGISAHWKYKEGEITEDENEMNEWLRTIKEILDDPQPDAMDFLDAIKLNLFASEIFVFTPKGEIKTMPAGCTALDFAFTIHSFIGSHCIGAKVNHKLVPISHKLESGDQVEILTSKSQHVEPAWVGFATTAKAKSKIQALLRRREREEQKIGEELLTQFLKRHDMEITILALDRLCQFHERKTHEDLFRAIGKKNIVLGESDIEEIVSTKKAKIEDTRWNRFKKLLTRTRKYSEDGTTQVTELLPDEKGLLLVTEGFDRKIPCLISEKTYSMYRFSTCCHPIPGDDIMGYIDNDNHVVIHQRNCHVAEKLKSTYGKRILDAKWDMHKQMLFVATVRLSAVDRIGLLHDVVEIISHDKNVDIYQVNTKSDLGVFEGEIKLRVHDRDDMTDLVDSLKHVQGMQEVNQII